MARHDIEPITLDRLLAGFATAPSVAVPDITLDSRAVEAGAVFLARQGGKTHGLQHAPEALRRGAGAIVYETVPGFEPPGGPTVPWVAVPVLGERLGEIAGRYFGTPSTKLRIAAVTGTNGKTTVTHLLAGALSALSRRAAYLGTIGAGFPGRLADSRLTTPDVVELNRALAGFVTAEAEFTALEASSHALAQRRLAGVRIQCAALTNLSRDHLDYHGTMARYRAAKASLFGHEGIEQRVIAVDDDFGRELAGRYPDAIQVSVGAATPSAPRFVHVTSADFRADGLTFTATTHAGDVALRSPLLGRFNVANLAVALGLLLALDIGPEPAAAALAGIDAPAGRMRRIQRDRGPLAIVDYAHTPAALAAVLDALRPHARGRLVCVFGCGGDRDAGKRAPMAVAAAAADAIVITSDNPRSERPQAIVDAIVAGVPAGRPFDVIVDRYDAIQHAITEAGADDIVLIAGKGHEQWQEIGGERRPFDDAAVALTALAEWVE
ncbi:MAG: UDP-N-acetylmuramoyl-L-alanyl-D-glutamate--2,6-diaminopimelate ligase [Pseudomonadota bacterium]